METNPKCNFSVSLWREIIFWILKFWQPATVKMACQRNDFLSSGSLVKGRILFLLIFNFYSIAAEFLFLNSFFPSDSFSSPFLLRFLHFCLAPKLNFFSWDGMVQLSILAASSSLVFVCRSMWAGDGVSKSRASLILCSFESVGGCFLVEAAEFEWIWQALLPSQQKDWN